MIDDQGWLVAARPVLSPNYNQRPHGVMVDLLVIHHISLPAKQFGGPWIDQLFTNQLDIHGHNSFAELAAMRVSAHLLINRLGELTQYVSLKNRAWHAGPSQFQGRDHCNDFSIGIELEGTGDIPFTDAQYERLITVTQWIRQAYPAITRERIVGHSDIAPGRKTDPGPSFDWCRYLGALTP